MKVKDIAQSSKERAEVMEAMEENSQSLAKKDVSWINKALKAPEKAKMRETTKAWKVEGSPLNMMVGTGLPSM